MVSVGGPFPTVSLFLYIVSFWLTSLIISSLVDMNYLLESWHATARTGIALLSSSGNMIQPMCSGTTSGR